jgi:hypothetical protein
MKDKKYKATIKVIGYSANPMTYVFDKNGRWTHEFFAIAKPLSYQRAQKLVENEMKRDSLVESFDIREYDE